MTPTSTSRIHLLLVIATGILLLTGTVAAWALPHPLVGADPAPRASASSTADPCRLVFGAVRDICRTHTVDVAAPAAPAAPGSSSSGAQAPWLLLFATVTIAAAIGLAVTAGQQPR
jgi:hypothetical protein